MHLFLSGCFFAYLSSTPRQKREVIRRPTAYRRHGNFTPGRITASCSHCLRRFNRARTVTEQEYLTIAGHGRIGSYLMLTAYFVSLLQRRSWRSVLHGFRFRRDNGNVPDECIFLYQGAKDSQCDDYA